MNKQYVIALLMCLVFSASEAKTLRWSSQGDILTVDPHAQNDTFTNAVNGQVYESLITRDTQMKFVPALADSWQQVSPTTWRFKLRKDVRFHNGSSFSAQDVLFSITRAKETTSAMRVFAVGLGEITAIDDLTVEFNLGQFSPVFLENLSTVLIMNKEWSEKNNSAKPQDFKNKESKFSALNANGTGPYVLVSRQPDVRTVFQRNANWWGKFLGNVQDVIYSPVKSDATRSAALISGELDFILDPVPQDIQKLRSGATKVIEGMENRVIFIGMDQGRDELLYSNVKGKNPFKDLRVRRAMYQAIDIEAIKTRLMHGQAIPTGSITPSPLGSFSDPNVERRLPYDLSRAKELMAEAGYEQGFEVALDCPNNRYINDEEICIALSSMWAQIGIKIRLNAQPRAVYFPKAEKLDVSLFMLGWGGASTDAETVLTPVLRNRGEAGVGYFNWGNYKNNKLDALVALSSRESDPAKRERLIIEALIEHNEQVHHIPLHRQIIPWAMRGNVDVVHRPDNRFEWRWVTIK